MGGGRISFDVQIWRNDHWVSHQHVEDEKAARKLATALLGDRRTEGVRVLRNWLRPDGDWSESVIFTEMNEAPAGPVQIVPVETAPICLADQDYFGLRSRMTLNRLLRNYFDKYGITPTELLYSHRQLKRFQGTDGLFPAAVDRIATAQARQLRDDARARRDALYEVIARITARARQAAERANLPSLADGNFGRIVQRLERAVGAEERDYLALTVLARDLENYRNWLGKLRRQVELAQNEMHGGAAALLDGVLADLFGVPQLIQDVLGYQRDLATALCRMIDLAEGKLPPEILKTEECLPALNRLMAEDALPDSRSVVMERVHRQLKGSHPLDRANPEREAEAFTQVAARLVTARGMAGGEDTAEALTWRYSKLVEQGGKTGQRLAIMGVADAMTETCSRLAYLVQLSNSPLGQDHVSEILTRLHGMLATAANLRCIVPTGGDVRDSLTHATGLYDSIQASALPGKDRVALGRRIDELLADYVLYERVIEAIDDPARPLRDRATQLVKFCSGGFLPVGGKAQAMARRRVVELLRQPRFDDIFTEGIADPEERARMLRDFHDLLTKAGFG